MASNFLKRAGKAQEPVTPEVQVVAEEPEATYPHSGFDIYTPDGGKNYKVAEISYNADTGEAKVTNTFDITRLVALSYANQKGALNSLKKRTKNKETK